MTESKEKYIPPYTIGEEIANSITHGIGTALSIAALVLLVVFASMAGKPWQIVSFSIYGTSLIFLYLASTLYHSFQSPKVKKVFKILDHSAIYLLIAGTYTPFLLIAMRGGWGWSLFGVVWGLAVIGIVLKAIFVFRFKVFSIILYLTMGWLILISSGKLFSSVPASSIIWLITGGLLYSSGVIFYIWKKLTFNHAIWHIFVLSGSICHFFAMLCMMKYY
jgi:hemolysin III